MRLVHKTDIQDRFNFAQKKKNTLSNNRAQSPGEVYVTSLVNMIQIIDHILFCAKRLYIEHTESIYSIIHCRHWDCMRHC